MVLAVESPTQISLTSPAPSGCNSPAHIEPESNHSRPSTPKRVMQSLMGGRISPFRVNSAGVTAVSGFLSRSSSSSCRSSSKESRNKRHSQALDTASSPVLTVDTATKAKPAGMTSPFGPLSSPMFAQFESKDETLGSPMIIIQSLSSSDPHPHSAGVTSPAGGISSATSTTSTLSVETEDEDLISTRSASPLEDLTDSQLTTTTSMSMMTETIVEDLPESLRLMRVAQRHGIKVVDFAFEGPKREGQVEEWAWEGGAACKGFGIGFGGGAYNGALKKYRPPPKEREDEDEDAMIIDSPPSPQKHDARPQNIFASGSKHRPPPIFSGAKASSVERPFNSPGLNGPQSRSPPQSIGVSGSDFMRYLEERRANEVAAVTASIPQPHFHSVLGTPTDGGSIKRDRSFGSSEPSPDGRSPYKRRVLG